MLRPLPNRGRFALETALVTLLPKPLLRIVWYGPGKTAPDPALPFVTLLRPYSSEVMYLFSALWTAAALYQFGQPIMPTDAGSVFWSRKAGYRLPTVAAWKRSMFGFDRMFTEDLWSFEVANLVTRSSLVVMDVSKVTPSLIEELIIVEARDRIDRLVCIADAGHRATWDRDWVSFLRGAGMARAADAIAAAIPYGTASAAELDAFWSALVARCAERTGVDLADLPHPDPPERLFTRAESLVRMLASRARWRPLPGRSRQ